jgi:hypothetical protein
MKGTQYMTGELTRRTIGVGGRFAAECLEKLQTLKEKVAANLSSEFAGVLNPIAVRRVVNDAEALASTTPFPALFLPTLAEEKAQRALEWETRQRAIRSRSISFAA